MPHPTKTSVFGSVSLIFSRRYKLKACRARCTGAVLAEQERQDTSEMDIALALFAQTKKALVDVQSHIISISVAVLMLN